MAILINFFDNVILQAISEEIVPKVSFFKDRYFPTGAGDIFKANEVLTEYRSGDRKLAAFVDQKAGDIPIGRRSYEVHSYKPAYIAPSRLLTLDELTKRGFGEALYPGMDEAQRAARLLADDMNDMENRIARREEWMAAETMIGNGCVMQEYIDGATKGDSLVVKFYDGTSDHTYTASKKWNENGGDFWGDVKAMCRMLSARGLPAKDLILGTDVADYILTDERTRQLLDKNSGIIVGEIRQQLTQYDGVVFMGTLNFGGFMLNVFSVDETYEDETGKSAWCREHGVYPAELDQWCASATAALVEPEESRASLQATRQDKKRIKALERELLRKDRALAETAALLVLSKKVAAIFNKGEAE